MCVTTNYAELFFNALTIEKSYYFSSGYAAVRGTGKLSSLRPPLVYIIVCLDYMEIEVKEAFRHIYNR